MEALSPRIKQICKISGTPGASIGVAQKGKTVWKGNFGYRDFAAKKPPDEWTIYHVASLTKSFSGLAVASLVSDGHLQWNTSVVESLPEFRLRDETLTSKAHVVDILSHRLGIAGGNALWTQGGNRNHIAKEEILRIIAGLQQVANFRDTFSYHNLAYGVVAELVERLSGQTYGEFLQDKIINPLALKRTVIKATEPEPENRAVAYSSMDDGSFALIPRPESQDGTIQAAAGGVRSCVADLLVYFSAILDARNSSFTRSDSSSASIIKEAAMVTSGHNFITKGSRLEKSYALGLLRAQLPNTFGDVGPNVGLVDSMPTIGNPTSSQLVIFGQGSFPGFLSSVFLLEQSETVIVVLTNSLALNDAADWIGQLILEEILDVEKKTDFAQLAEASKSKYLKNFAEAEQRMNNTKKPDSPRRPLNDYAGDYYNSLHNFFIRIISTKDGLLMCFQGEDWDVYELEVIDKDSFSWWLPREEQAKRGRWPIDSEEFFRFNFSSKQDGKIAQLTWAMDPDVPSGETFVKEPLAITNFKGKALSQL